MYFSILHSESLMDLKKSDSTRSSIRDGSILKSIPSVESIKTLQSISQTIENKELLVNPNCPMGIILDFICHELGFEKHYEFDLCEFDSGEMLGVKQFKPHSYGTTIFKSGQTYVVVFFEKDEYGNYLKYEPLLSKSTRAYSNIMLLIQRTQNPSYIRKSSALKKKRGTTASNVSSNTLNQKLQVSPHRKRSSAKYKEPKRPESGNYSIY